MSEENKKDEFTDTTRFDSQVAQTVEATGNFLNNIKNPWFFMTLFVIIGSGYLFYKSTYLISDSLNNIATKIEKISDLINDQKVQEQKNLDEMSKIVSELKDRHLDD
jgi:hypothetical protein